MEKWIAARGGWEDDQWVEAVPYLETRKYVMRVLRSLHVYRVLYADGEAPSQSVSSRRPERP